MQHGFVSTKNKKDQVDEKAIHVQTSHDMGLGFADPNKILFKESVLS